MGMGTSHFHTVICSLASVSAGARYSSVADLGFSEGGSVTVLCAKIYDHAHFLLNHAHFRSFWREMSCSTCQSINSFRSRFILMHAKVSHRSNFLRSPAKEEGSI